MVRKKLIRGFHLIICSIALFTMYVNSEMLAENVIVAVNCGGDSYTDSKGITYEKVFIYLKKIFKDNYFSAGQESDFGTNFEIKLTDEPELYQTERWSSEDLHYDLPISSPGKYVLVLKFSEVYFNSPTEKIFDVALGKDTIIKNIDIYSKVGKAAAYDEFVEFELKNNKIYIRGKPVEGGYDEENGSLRVTFVKGERDNPKINAIAVIKGTLADTDYQSFKSKLEQLEKEKSEKDRKQREIKKKSRDYDYEEFEDDFVDIEASKENKSSFFSFSTFIFLGVFGYVIYAIFIKNKRDQDLKED